MFVVSNRNSERRYSPHSMAFGPWNVFDISTFHSFWQRIVERESAVYTGETIWAVLLRAYKINLFSPLASLSPFATDYFTHFYRGKVSNKNLTDTLSIFHRLGLEKVGHLRRLPPDQIQKRFGKPWTQFLRGIISPEEADWSWEPTSYQEPLLWSSEFDFACVDGAIILAEAQAGLHALADKHPLFGLDRMTLALVLTEVTEEASFEFAFTYKAYLKKDLSWMTKLIEERLVNLILPYPVAKILLTLFPAGYHSPVQLTLFENKIQTEAWKEICQKLENQKFQVFIPSSTASYLPEEAWTQASPLSQNIVQSSHGLWRPLIQHLPEKIDAPEGAIKFTERLAWFDKRGEAHQRDYFIMRGEQRWLWVFHNEQNEWFKQGVAE